MPQHNARNGSTRAWRRLRSEILREQPLCQLRLDGCTLRATTVDHTIPLAAAPQLRYERSNLRSACQSCNRIKSDLPLNRLAEFRTGAPQLTDRQKARRRTLKYVEKQRNPAPALRIFDPQTPPAATGLGA